MAMVETTFTVQVQTWVNPGETQVRIDYLRTWRELYRQIANAGIGWTLEVITDTLNGKNGGTFAGKMTHTATGLWYDCYCGTSTSSGQRLYTAANKSIGWVWLATPMNISSGTMQNVYFVDNINGGTFQECRMSQGSSYCLWRIAQGELIDGTSEGYCGMNYYDHNNYSEGGIASSTTSIIHGLLWGYSDRTGDRQSINYSGIYGTVGSASQLYIGRCYGIREGQTNGIIVTWGGKKTWRTGYNLVPKATYSINGTRYTALSANILLEE